MLQKYSEQLKLSIYDSGKDEQLISDEFTYDSSNYVNLYECRVSLGLLFKDTYSVETTIEL